MAPSTSTSLPSLHQAGWLNNSRPVCFSVEEPPALIDILWSSYDTSGKYQNSNLKYV